MMDFLGPGSKLARSDLQPLWCYRHVLDHVLLRRWEVASDAAPTMVFPLGLGQPQCLPQTVQHEVYIRLYSSVSMHIVNTVVTQGTLHLCVNI
jgi:hypothetical protein